MASRRHVAGAPRSSTQRAADEVVVQERVAAAAGRSCARLLDRRSARHGSVVEPHAAGSASSGAAAPGRVGAAGSPSGSARPRLSRRASAAVATRRATVARLRGARRGPARRPASRLERGERVAQAVRRRAPGRPRPTSAPRSSASTARGGAGEPASSGAARQRPVPCAGRRRCGSASPQAGARPRAPKTSASSSELLARRLAPCTPVQATSPAAQRPGSDRAPVERPSRRRPCGSARPARPGSARGAGRGRAAGRPRRRSGSAPGRRRRRPRARRGRRRGPAASAAKMPRATTSRGASSASRIRVAHEAAAALVDQQRARAAQRLGQRAASGRRRCRAPSGGTARTRGRRGARRPRRPARGRRRWPRPGSWCARRGGRCRRSRARPRGARCSDAARRRRGARGRRTRAPAVEHELERLRALEDGDGRVRAAQRCAERAHDLGARRVARVQRCARAEWAASRARSSWPSASRSKRAPSASSSREPLAAVAASGRATAAASAMPAADGQRVGARAAPGESSGPTARGDAALRPRAVARPAERAPWRAGRRAGRRGRERRCRPADAGAEHDDVGLADARRGARSSPAPRPTASMRSTAGARARRPPARPRPGARSVCERLEDLRQRDPLHVRAEVAGPHELHRPGTRRPRCRHRALGDEHDARAAAWRRRSSTMPAVEPDEVGRGRARPAGTPGGRAPRSPGAGGGRRAISAPVKRSCTSQWPFQRMISTFVCEAT